MFFPSIHNDRYAVVSEFFGSAFTSSAGLKSLSVCSRLRDVLRLAVVATIRPRQPGGSEACPGIGAAMLDDLKQRHVSLLPFGSKKLKRTFSQSPLFQGANLSELLPEVIRNFVRFFDLDPLFPGFAFLGSGFWRRVFSTGYSLVIDRFIDRFVSRFRYYWRTVFGTTGVPFSGQLAYRFWVVPFLGCPVFGTSVFGPILYVQKVLI